MPITRIGPASTPSTVRVPQVGTQPPSSTTTAGSSSSSSTNKPGPSTLSIGQRHPSSLLPVKSSHHYHRSSLSTPGSHRNGFISDSTTDTDESSSSSSSELDGGSTEVKGSDDDEEQGQQSEDGGYFTQRKRSRKKVKRRKRFRGTSDEQMAHVSTLHGVGSSSHPLSSPPTPPPPSAPTPQRTKPPIDYLALATAERRRSSTFASTLPSVPASLLSTSSESISSERRPSGGGGGGGGGVLSGLGKVGLVGRGISVADITTVEPLTDTHASSPVQTHPPTTPAPLPPPPPISPTSSTESDSQPTNRRTSLNILSGAFDPTSIRRDPTDLGTQYAIDAGVTAHSDLDGRGKHHFSAYSRGHGKRQSQSGQNVLSVGGLEMVGVGAGVGAGAGTGGMREGEATRPQVKTAQSGYFSSLNQAAAAAAAASLGSETSLVPQPGQQQQQPQPQGAGEPPPIDLTPVARKGTLPVPPPSPPSATHDAYTTAGAGIKTVTNSPVVSTSRAGISLQRIPSFHASSSTSHGDKTTASSPPPAVAAGAAAGGQGRGEDHDIPPPSNPRKYRSPGTTTTTAAAAGVLLSRVRAHPGGRGEYGLVAQGLVSGEAGGGGGGGGILDSEVGQRRGSGVLGLDIEKDEETGGANKWGVADGALDHAARYSHHHPYAQSVTTSPVKQFHSLSASSSSSRTADQLRRSPRARGLQRHRSGEVLAFRRSAEQDAAATTTSTGFATVGNLLARRNFTLPFPSDRTTLEHEHTGNINNSGDMNAVGVGSHLVPDINANGRLVILTPTTQEWRELGLDHLKDLGGEGVGSESESERGRVGWTQEQRRESEAMSESSIISLVDNPEGARTGVESRRSSSLGVGDVSGTKTESGRTSRPRSDTVHSVDNLLPEDRSSDTHSATAATMPDRVGAKDLVIQIPTPSSGSVSFLEASDDGGTPDRSGTSTGTGTSGGRGLSLSLRSAPPLLEETDIFAKLLSEQMAQRQRQSSSATSSGVQSRALSPALGTANAMEQASSSNSIQDKPPSTTHSPRPLQENLGSAFSLSRSQSMREPPSAAPHMTKREKERERLFRMVGEEIERSGFSDSQGAAARGIKQIGRGLGLESPVSSGGNIGFPIIRTESGPAELEQRDHQKQSPNLSDSLAAGTDEPLLLPLPQKILKQLTADVPMPSSASDDMARSSSSSAKSRSRAHSRAPSLAQLAIPAGTGPRVEHPSMSPPGPAAPAPLSALTSRRRQSQRLSLLAGRTPLPHQFPAVLPPSAPTGPHGPRKPSAGLSAFSAFATITPASPPVRRPLLNKDTSTSGSLSAIPGHLQHNGRSDSTLSFAPSTTAPSECGTPVGETAGGLGGGGIDDYVIQSEVGKGAYGLVRRARRKGEDGNPVGNEVIIKYIIKSRILADCWKKHKVLGPIPIEIHVMEQLRNVTYRKPKAPHPWDPLRAGHPDFPDQPETGNTTGTGQDTPKTSHSSELSDDIHSHDDTSGRIESNIAKPGELHDLSAWQAKLSNDNLEDRGHPNIVKMLDFFEDREFYYLVMPRFGAGLDLFDRVESAPDGLDPFDIRSLLGQLSDALAFLHTNGIVHRDIKDENVILDGQGHCQLIDFGSAAHWRPGRKWDTFSGTLDYASPEILRGEMYSGKEQDVWALGVVAFVMICGETPFLSAEEAAVGLADGTKARDDLMARCGGGRGDEGEESDGGGRMADALDFVERCLELKVEDRPPAEALMEHRFVFGRDGWSGFKGWLHV